MHCVQDVTLNYFGKNYTYQNVSTASFFEILISLHVRQLMLMIYGSIERMTNFDKHCLKRNVNYCCWWCYGLHSFFFSPDKDDTVVP